MSPFTSDIILAKLKELTKINDSGCWEYQGGKDKDGYGKIYYRGRHWRVHRLSFFIYKGIEPNICRHSCNNSSCWNPEHLSDGTIDDNNKDQIKTYCIRGHKLDNDNIYYAPKSGARQCKQCRRLREKVYDAPQYSRVRTLKAWKN